MMEIHTVINLHSSNTDTKQSEDAGAVFVALPKTGNDYPGLTAGIPQKPDGHIKHKDIQLGKGNQKQSQSKKKSQELTAAPCFIDMEK